MSKIHIIIAAVWVPLAIILAMRLAILGNSELALAKSRGADNKARIDLGQELDQLKGQLEYEASEPALRDAIQRLGLPLNRQLNGAVMARR